MDQILDANAFDAGEYNKEDFEHYRSFYNTTQAQPYVELLQTNNIPFLLEGSENILDKAIVGTTLRPNIILKLQPKHFITANQLIESLMISEEGFDVDEHYLNQLDDAELQEIFEKLDEWSIEDVQVARLILKNRGISIEEEEIQALRSKRLDELRQGKKGNRLQMLLYGLSAILGLVIHPILTIAGIGMGYYYTFGKSTDPDGVKYSTFDAETQKIGKLIFYGGILALIVALGLLFFRE